MEREADAEVFVCGRENGDTRLAGDRVGNSLQLRVHGAQIELAVLVTDSKLLGEVVRGLRLGRRWEAIGRPGDDDAALVVAEVNPEVVTEVRQVALAGHPAEVVDDVDLQPDAFTRPLGDGDRGVADGVLVNGDEGGAELGAGIPDGNGEAAEALGGHVASSPLLLYPAEGAFLDEPVEVNVPLELAVGDDGDADAVAELLGLDLGDVAVHLAALGGGGASAEGEREEQGQCGRQAEHGLIWPPGNARGAVPLRRPADGRWWRGRAG